MPADNNAPMDGLDERLSDIRNAELREGEKVVAQEMGDQGQAIVLTDSRVLVIKAGLTATGTLNGRRSKAIDAAEISSVAVRKGPMGAVIQIRTTENASPSDPIPPDNVIIFSGPQKLRKCEAFATKVASTLAKPLEKISPSGEHETPAPKRAEADDSVIAEAASEVVAEASAVQDEEPKAQDTPRGGREPKSLAEEMFEELSERKAPAQKPSTRAPKIEPIPSPFPEAAPEPTSAVEALATEALAAEMKADTGQGFGHNPLLPAPKRAKMRTGGALVLIGALAAAVLMGIAITAPLRSPSPPAAVLADPEKAADTSAATSKDLAALFDYRENVMGILQDSSMPAAALKAALQSGDRKSMLDAAQRDASAAALQALSAMPAPTGLASAKECLTSALLLRKNEAATLIGSIQASAPVDTKRTLSRLAEADALVRKGMSAISVVQKQLSGGAISMK